MSIPAVSGLLLIPGSPGPSSSERLHVKDVCLNEVPKRLRCPWKRKRTIRRHPVGPDRGLLPELSRRLAVDPV